MENIYSAFRSLSSYKKALAFSSLLLITVFQSYAQKKSQSDHSRITATAYLENMLRNPLNSDYMVTSEHISSISGVKHTYVRQAILGIEVQGTESSLHMDASGNTILAHVNFVDDIESSVLNTPASITAEQAIVSVAQQMGYQISNLQIIENLSGINQQGLFNKGGISNSNIPVKLLYYFQDGIGTSLVWDLTINELDSANWWNFKVDASSGTIIGQDNWTLTCASSGDHSEAGHKAMRERKLNHKAALNPALKTENALLASSYTVFSLPMESPYSGPRITVVDPDDPSASPLGWHDDGATMYTYTKGNNVSAYDDALDDDDGTEADHTPESSAGFIFDYPFEAIDGGGNPIYTMAAQSEDASITNLFYWNNIIHDITYKYGFTEAAGNFQETNFGLGGVGGDSVEAQSQDSAELVATSSNRCNANFSTCPDGMKSTMQMYICEGAGPPDFNDASYDNVVVIHEYGHGISNRLVGGPSHVFALHNVEQMGEGWSDFYGYMLTMDGTNFMDDRVVGNFLADLGPTGPGFRPAPYSIDGMVNGFTYADVADAGTITAPHGIGFIWATMLYDMTQILIGTYGFDPDLYTGSGGNNIALKLVTEGLKFTPPLPGFEAGRDAILAADYALTGGENDCIIWTAFAGRGLGFSASQGDAFDRFDGVEAFDMPVATLVPSKTSLCDSDGTVTGLTGGRLTGGMYSGPFVIDGGDGKSFSFDATAAGLGMHTITYDDFCTGTTAMASIEVLDGSPVVVCSDVTITLDGTGAATIIADQVISNLTPGDGSLGYFVDETGTFAPVTIVTPPVTLGDDTGTSFLPIGFDFDFFGSTFTAFYIASNGFVSLTGAGMSGEVSFTPTTIPTAVGPNGMIALVWDDLSPNISGTINYETIGIAPDRKLIVNFDAVPLFDTSETVTVQLQLYEGSNIIEIHTTLAENDSGDRTQGIENLSGDEGYTSTGRNLADWTAASSYVAFKPISSGMPDICASPMSIEVSQTTFTCDDIGDNDITITIDGGTGGVATCTATVTVVGPTSTYTGAWDVVPDATRKAIFEASYDTTDLMNPSIDACSCDIESTATVTVAGGDYMKIEGDITVDGTLIVEHTGSVVQVDDDALVTKNGTINVHVSTPSVDTRDFIMSGSPMTAETREGVYTAAHNVQAYDASLFDDSAAVAGQMGVVYNFQGETLDQWSPATGVLTPAAGYLVFPQTSFTAPGGIFLHDYITGTLNTGVVTYPLLLAADAGSLNANMLSNPYASAINADLFMAANAEIDAVYFWEHGAPPSPMVPGPNPANFTMEDVSVYNGTGGMLASSGAGTVPNGVISTAQGFGVFATGAGTATFNNSMRLTSGNTTLRATDDAKSRIWLNIVSESYEIGGNALVGFMNQATAAYEAGYDNYRMNTMVSLFSQIDADVINGYSIQGRESFDADMQIQLGFSTQIEENTTYRVSIADFDGPALESHDAYLVDNVLGTVTNLSKTDYAFSSEEGTFFNRFTLQFVGRSVLGTNEANLNAVVLSPNPTNGFVNIISPRALVNSLLITDIQGRVVNTITVDGLNTYQLDVSNLGSAVYFIQVATDAGAITKRLIKK